jgi:hypothetical protein
MVMGTDCRRTYVGAVAVVGFDELADDVCVLTIQQELTVVIYEPYL